MCERERERMFHVRLVATDCCLVRMEFQRAGDPSLSRGERDPDIEKEIQRECLCVGEREKRQSEIEIDLGIDRKKKKNVIHFLCLNNAYIFLEGRSLAFPTKKY